MQHAAPHSEHHLRGTLDDFVAGGDIVALQEVPEDAWNAIRRSAGRTLVWQFATLRNLFLHRGHFGNDAFGFAWGGIYRTLFVSSIVTTSYRNEGHFRSGERIFGTGDFFRGSFILPKSSAEVGEITRLVNLRHHVAGVVQPDAAGHVRVNAGYEADYTYVATAFVESIRRGLALCGLPADSPRGRAVAEQMCTVLYQLAGFTGLTRMPRDLAAHERFRDAYDRRLRERPPSPRVRRMAQEIARRIVPITASHANSTVSDHIRRHLDDETRDYLFPGDHVPAALDEQRRDWQRRIARAPSIVERSQTRQALWQQPTVAALHDAYLAASSDSTDDRLIGAILLHAIDSGSDAVRHFERRTIELAAGEALIRQDKHVGEMYVVLASTAPLVVLHRTDAGPEPRQVATITAPTVLGEIGMWRGQPAVATVLTREPNRLDVLVIDQQRFEALKQESGFRAAAAAEVQRRLAINSALVGTLLDDVAAASGDPRLGSIAQLFRYLTGDSHVPLDKVVDLAIDATPAECVEALRHQVDEVVRAGGLPVDLEQYLAHVVATIG